MIMCWKCWERWIRKCSADCFESTGAGCASGALHIVEELVMQGRELTQLAADFTWYLRNLLLVKTSDNMEDVLDVSTENLAQLKEEAQMIEQRYADALYPYFSELSGTAKYATQKRVLLEVALIKLCNPAMETDQDALLDRIRAVEEKVEKELLQPQICRSELFMNGDDASSSGSGVGKPQNRNRSCRKQFRRMCRRW